MLCLHSDVGFATTAAGTGAQGDRGTWETLPADREAVKCRGASILKREGKRQARTDPP